MSKYTKALEKVQEKRSGKVPVEETNSVASAVVAPSDRVDPPVKQTAPVQESHIKSENSATADERIIMLRFPDSMLAEQYRMLRTSLRTELDSQQSKVLMTSSSIHSEGKTVTATNLSVAFAENPDTRVLLIDADLRRGKVSQYLGFGSKKEGLSSVLQGESAARDVMLKTVVPNLTVIPRGSIPDKPAEAVSSSKLQLMIEELKSHFDYIIVDAPPIMSVADAGVISKCVDGILFIVQVGRTPKSVIAHSQELLRQSGGKIMGCVLTNVEFQSADYRYYNNYYSYYGEGDIKEGLAERSKYELKKAGWGLRNLEEKFNDWWDKRVLKKK